MTAVSVQSRRGRARARGVKLFASPREEPRFRRATDFIALGISLTTVTLLGFVAEPPSSFEKALIELADAVPPFLKVLWQTSSDLLAVWTVVVLIVAVARRRTWIALDALLAAALGLTGAMVAFRLVDGSWPHVLDALGSASAPAQLPSLRLALCAAVVTSAAPHLTRPFRRVGRWLVGLGALSLVFLGATTPVGALMAFGIATAAAAAVHLVLGSVAGRPGLSSVADALEDLGIEASDLAPAVRQPAGVFTVEAVDPGGHALTVKVYGRDAWDTQLLAKAWRALWYREADTVTLTRLQQVEHEAFLTLLAGNAGVPVAQVVTAGRTPQNDALLVVRRSGMALADVDRSTVDDDLLRSIWEVAGKLHMADVAHGNLGPLTLVRGDGGALVTGFGGATVAPTGDQLLADQAQVLITTALLAGPHRALEVALAELDAAGLTTVLPYLQTAALGRDLKHAVRAAKLDVDDLRKNAAAVAGAEAPEMAKLRRVTARNLVMVGVLSLAAYAVISSLSGVDWSELWDEVQGAEWGWVVLGLFFAQTPRFGEAIGTRGASSVPLPYGLTVALEFAICFVNLAVPTAAGRIAVEVGFFQRQGLQPAAAMSIGAIDSFGGFLVQMLTLLVLVVLGVGSVDLNMSLTSVGSSAKLVTALVVALAVVALVAVVFLVVPKLRRRLWTRVQPWVHQIVETVRGVRSPARFLQILGGNFMSQVLFAVTLGLFLKAFGVSLSLGTLLVCNVAASLFAGLMPVPGGIGVTEGALVTMLVAAGVNETQALAAVTLYRGATFYLPPIWGAVSFRWLERHRYL